MDKQWVPGQNAIYERFAEYKPREEAPSWAAGGKVAKIDRIEWLPLTEVSAAVGALMQGEVDWYEQPPVDLLPLLKSNPDIAIENVPLGLILLMRFNHQQPPFNNPGVRRAVMMAVNQTDYMEAVVGSKDYYQGVPRPSSRRARRCRPGRADRRRSATMSSAPRRCCRRPATRARRCCCWRRPTSRSPINQCLVTQELLKKLGMNVDLVATDWASFIGRRSNRGLPDQGGWSLFHTLWSGADVLNPALHPLLRANGSAAWFGWPDDPTLEGLRDQWIATPDAAKQKELAAAIETRAFETVPYAPGGLVQQPMAYRKSLTGMVLSPVQFFWNMEKKA